MTFRAKLGLSHLPTERLQALLRVVDEVGTPVSMPALMLAGFADLADQAPVLIGLDRTGLRAVLVVALAERIVRR
jgi:hypothetical protein